jgi:Family of unknown function (DUF5343)
MASDYPYTLTVGKFKEFMLKIREIGVPEKANTIWLPTVGFKSKNHRVFISILKFVEFIDGSGIPTENWKTYRQSGHGNILANALRNAYADLFAIYSDANSRSVDELKDFFSSKKPSAGKSALAQTVSTFKALCELADFSGENENVVPLAGTANANAINQPTMNLPPQPSANPSPSSATTPSVHIDIQIHISADAKPNQIDQIFKSMAEHLYDRKS